jgi:hypothetical protein
VISLAILGGIGYRETLPSKTPLSLLEVYITDFPEYLSQRRQMTLSSTTGTIMVKILATKYYDFLANAYFYSVYLPGTDQMFDLCNALARQYKEIIETPLSSLKVSGRRPGDTSTMLDEDLMFAGRVYIYHNRELKPDEIGDLFKIFREKKLSVQFRSWEYLSHHIFEYDRREDNHLRQFVEQNSEFLRENPDAVLLR